MIYISHRLGEVKSAPTGSSCCATGGWSASWRKDELSHAAMIRLMIGRDLKSLYIPPKAPPRPGGCEITDVRDVRLSRTDR